MRNRAAGHKFEANTYHQRNDHSRAPSKATAKCFRGEERKLPVVQAGLYFITEICLEDGLSHRKQGNWSLEKL